MEEKILLSFVIPCYRSEHTIRLVTDEIIETVSQRPEYDYEIICVNDCSPDGVYAILRALAEENPKIKVVDLMKNMGKHAAVLAGYSFAKGDYIVNLDDDCQCPVYELWKLLEPVEHDKADVATARYHKKEQAVWKNVGSAINAWVGSFMLDKPAGLRIENFRVLKRIVAHEATKYPHPYPYIEGLILRVTNRIVMVDMYERERTIGTSGYTFLKSFMLFLNGFTAFSVKPLRLATIIGFVTAFSGFLFFLRIIFHKLLYPATQAGYSSIMSVLLFLGGLIMLFLGLIGEYVGRIYICLNRAPQYVIRDTINLSQPPAEQAYRKEVYCYANSDDSWSQRVADAVD